MGSISIAKKYSYICLNITCKLHGDIFDASVTKLKVMPGKIQGAISSGRGASLENIIETVPEERGIDNLLQQDPYDKNDPEPGEDERLKQQG